METMLKDDADIVRDILYRVQEVVGTSTLPPEKIRDLEIEIKTCWGGDVIKIRSAKYLRAHLRNRRLLEEWLGGADSGELARKYRISTRTIARVLKTLRK